MLFSDILEERTISEVRALELEEMLRRSKSYCEVSNALNCIDVDNDNDDDDDNRATLAHKRSQGPRVVSLHSTINIFLCFTRWGTR